MNTVDMYPQDGGSNTQVTNVARPRLNADGRNILKDFFEFTTNRPTHAQKNMLVTRVQAVGNEHYDFNKISTWFSNKRMTVKKELQAASTSQTCGPYSSISTSGTDALTSQSVASNSQPSTSRSTGPLTAELEESLRDLYKFTPVVIDDLVSVWARTLGVDLDTVQAWIFRQEKEEQGRWLGKLPTPGMDEEDQSSGSVQKRRKLSVPPIATRNEAPPEPRSDVSIPPVPQPVERAKKPTHSERLIVAIGQGIDNDERSRAASESSDMDLGTPSPPRMSRDAFLTAFAPYEIKMNGFMGKVGRGDLQNKGWMPDMAPVEYRTRQPYHDAPTQSP